MNYKKMTKAELVQLLELRERPLLCANPQTISDFLSPYSCEEQEHFLVLVLDSANHIKFCKVITVGIANRCLVHPREVFKVAIEHSGTSVVVAHNHPSGNLEPSEEDIDLTCRLKKAGIILGIQILDHIIFGNGNYHSMSESGEMIF